MPMRRAPFALLIATVFLAGCQSLESTLSHETHEKKGLEYLQSGDFKKAEEELRLASSMVARVKGAKAGHMGRIQYELGMVYRKQGKDQEAEEFYKRSLVVFSENPKIVDQSDRKHWAACLMDYADLLRKTDRAPEAEIRERQASELLNKPAPETPGQGPAPATETPPAAPDGSAGQPGLSPAK